MLNLYNTTIESLYIHKVGNKSRSEGVFLAKEETKLPDELSVLLKEFFLKPFRDQEEKVLKFHHEVDLEFNPVYNVVARWFKHKDETEMFSKAGLKLISKQLAKHLHDQHTHPHIKGGELYICHLKDMMIDNERVAGIGIFKSEIKQDFLQFAIDDNHLEVILSQGVNLAKLDKGAIIFNTNASDGFKVLSVDSNKYDTKYWLDSFLGVVEFEDSSYYTKRYLKMVKDFSKDVVLPAEDKKESVMFMNQTYNHFASNDDFEETRFLNEVCKNPQLQPEFRHYKEQNAAKYSIQDLSTFPISNTAVKESQKKFKSLIELDTNISIKLDFVNTDSANKFLEKGWDDEKQMYYYLCYFNSEKK
ncbi:MAG TPA: nucleoid-associated protein [Salinimicrobium sp.]|nr:nucleoid-associated protein [Salinimicrobium sp.]